MSTHYIYAYLIRVKPNHVEFTISLDDKNIIDMFKKYIPANWLNTIKKEHNVIKIRLRDQESIRKFIEILSPYFRLQTTKKVELLRLILLRMGKHKRSGYSESAFRELFELAIMLKSLQKKQKIFLSLPNQQMWLKA